MAADASEEVAEVGKRVHAQALAGGDQTGQDGGGLSPVVAAIKHPILPAHRDSTQAAFGAGMPTSGLCRAISHPMGSERESAALIVTEAA
jgi:hypothetical protein